MTGFVLASAWGPWAIILLLALGVLGLWLIAGRFGPRLRMGLRAGAAILALVPVALLAGASALQAARLSLDGQKPATGQFVDVGGYRAYVLCEGPAAGGTIVWLPGGYSLGAMMSPLHERIKAERRSCLIDRPGTGWADDAPLPRTTDDILRELQAALAGAGERGPFVLAGHSMGGLYAVNYAEAYPAEVRAVILLDPTPTLWFVEMAERMGCGPQYREDLSMWSAVFGLGLVRGLNPMWGPWTRDRQEVFGEAWDVIAAQETMPRTLAAEWSAGNHACTHPVAHIRTPGALNDLPLLKLVQSPPADRMAAAPPEYSQRVRRNWVRLQEAWEGEHLALTRKAQLVRAPAGFGHMFPITEADWTIDQIRPFLASLDGGQAPGETP